MTLRRKDRRRGFTFLEIMFVVVIIGILLALVGPRLVGRTERAREQTTRAQLRNLETAIRNFEMDNGTFPRTLQDLIDEPNDLERSWDGPYIEADVIPTDSWGEDFLYKAPGDNNRRGFDLWSKGADRQDNTEDDIANWTRR
ncbi:MAG: type II secretion system major pseudopilin GspG [Candidatus Sumerlaeia bacterium]|nr:type II secretion system major pseudopilin GspG [Candidatus Sumerlaeia bacterium]